MFPNFYGNAAVVQALQHMVRGERVAQTLLFDGPDGVGKATLARRFASLLLQGDERIERDDMSLPHNVEYLAEREKWTSEKRADDPLLFASHPDFMTFPPDGPLRQLAIQQMRLLKDRAQLKPSKGRWRVFLIDRIDRANEQAANSLLKTLEEPPDHLVLIMTAENAYDLLPTIRSRSVPFHLGPLTPDEMLEFARLRGLQDSDRRLSLAAGSPGVAVSLDLEVYDRRRAAMVAFLDAASGRTPFAEWMKHSEWISARKTEKLDYYLAILYQLLQDLVGLKYGAAEIRNRDIEQALRPLAARVPFEWIRKSVVRVDELLELLRRNIQKGIALDALVLELRGSVPATPRGVGV